MIRAAKTLQPDDTSANVKRASGTVRESAVVRPSGVIGSATRSRAGEYKRLKRLGAGQFGEVYLVESNTTGIKKAQKVMHRPPDDEGGKRELRSLDLIKNLRHPYLLRTEDFWIEENNACTSDGAGRLHPAGWTSSTRAGVAGVHAGVPPGRAARTCSARRPRGWTSCTRSSVSTGT